MMDSRRHGDVHASDPLEQLIASAAPTVSASDEFRRDVGRDAAALVRRRIHHRRVIGGMVPVAAVGMLMFWTASSPRVQSPVRLLGTDLRRVDGVAAVRVVDRLNEIRAAAGEPTLRSGSLYWAGPPAGDAAASTTSADMP